MQFPPPALDVTKEERADKASTPAVSGIRLLIVDSEAPLACALSESLKNYGFLSTPVHSVKTGWEAISAFTFDLILLDAALDEGEEAGFELAQRVRDIGFRQPILFLTSRNTLADRVRAHEHGDDYLSKPFEMPELVAKLQALSRRGPLPARATSWGELELVPVERKVYQSGELVSLTAVEYQLVELFMLNPDRLFLYDEILTRVWGTDHSFRSNNLTVHIKNIRAKIGDKDFLEVVRGLGYRLRS